MQTLSQLITNLLQDEILKVEILTGFNRVNDGLNEYSEGSCLCLFVIEGWYEHCGATLSASGKR